MNKQKSIQQFMQHALIRWATLGFVILVAIALAVSFLLAREQMASDLQESAKSAAQAFKEKILEGDIRTVEAQIKSTLQLKNNESVKILKDNYSPIYIPFSGVTTLHICPRTNVVCFDGWFGSAYIVVPISLDNSATTPFRHLYISRSIKLNWSFLAITFLLFLIGYLALVVIFARISKVASIQLGNEITVWARRIKENPKDSAPIQLPPFTELNSLKASIEGLNSQIEVFEKSATDKAKLLLLRGIAHDLLTPVSQLQLNIATLNSRIKSPENQALVQDIRESLKRVTTIASQVKTLKDSDSDESTELVGAIQEEISLLSQMDGVKAKSIKIDFISSQSKIYSPFSKPEVTRILTNLVQNAVDASKSEGLIAISVSTSKQHGIVEVKDMGKGIPFEFHQKIFEPDFTLKPGTGTGLGLAVVKYICNKRSAEISLKSKIDSGTTVCIQFPLLGGANV